MKVSSLLLYTIKEFTELFKRVNITKDHRFTIQTLKILLEIQEWFHQLIRLHRSSPGCKNHKCDLCKFSVIKRKTLLRTLVNIGWFGPTKCIPFGIKIQNKTPGHCQGHWISRENQSEQPDKCFNPKCLICWPVEQGKVSEIDFIDLTQEEPEIYIDLNE
jgi:hypothetical protein